MIVRPVPPARTDTSDAGLIEAIEADLVTSRILDFEIPVEAHLDGDVAWSFGALPFPYRCVATGARFDAAVADGRIHELAGPFAERGWGLSWWVAPWDTPDDLGARLTGAGLSREGRSPAMAIELDALPLDEPPPPGLEIEPVVDARAVATYLHVIASSLMEGPDADRRIAVFVDTVGAALATRIPLDPVPIRFLGRLDGRPVGTSRVSLSAGVPGLYSVVTAPDVRGRGIGRAMTLAALRAGRDVGHRIAVLQSSDAGLAVYRRLGFRELFSYDVYELPALA